MDPSAGPLSSVPPQVVPPPPASGPGSLDSAHEADAARLRRHAVIAGTIGNVLTAYDFIVYAFFAPLTGQLFFPDADPAFQLLASLATFGIGFVMRPLGGIVLAVYGDRKGRRASLTLAIALMTVGIFIFTATPTYAQIGIAAPIVIVIARLLQGFAAGGEFPGAMVYLSEYSLASRRGFFTSWQQSSQFFASLLGAFICTVVVNGLSAADLAAWGWRVPFAVGLVIGPAGFYIRNRLAETPVFRPQPRRAPGMLLGEALRGYWRAVLSGFGVVVSGTVSVYVIVLYLPTYVTGQFGIAPGVALTAAAAMSAVLVVLCPIFGRLSDRIGRKPVMLGASVAMVVLVYPLFRFFASAPGFGRLLLIEGIFAIVIAAFTAPSPAMMAELVPTRVRNTTISLSYNFAVAIFGGFGQFIVAGLIMATGDALAPAYYVLVAAIAGFIAVLPTLDRAGAPLD
jgi:MFS transporter, MHS family, proline/betaine transporter